ncbi:MAG: cell wall-active antibiotics response protein [Clostridiales bacterium]|nr:cell wall-active antibiotics response protein [Clostridiales bacterium]
MKGKRFTGAILIVLGAGLILERLGVISDFKGLISIWWPIVLIIGSGIQMISVRRFNGGNVTVMIVGILLLLKNLDIVDVSIYRLIWPTILVIVGLSFVFSKEFKFGKGRVSHKDTIDYFVMFSGIQERINSKNFRGGNIAAIFGGADIDLREAELDQKGAFMDIVAVFGGADIKVPEDWDVTVKGLPILGGWKNNTASKKSEKDPRKVLNIRCTAIFGGMEIK